ncbi:MAG: 4-hydroxythreonine-4-phosphate dehydrogenase PdxA [Verrucomicrobia bacterium]|nr:4-hydroxythreonine-4-phosphate dehydrogenase PdxA [Verrucomicrobiota bacterium]
MTLQPDKPVLGVTMGDPAGVGPELCLRLAAEGWVSERCRSVILGDASILRRASQALDLPMIKHSIPVQDWSAGAVVETPCIVDFANVDVERFAPGRVSADGGAASFAYIDHGITAAMHARIAGIVTCPINKEALRLAGIPFPGHTEILADRTRSQDVCMLQTSDIISAAFVTTHCAYADVPAQLTRERIQSVLEMSVRAMRRFRGRDPHVVVCGLNPHAGEHGLFGDEEEQIIRPVVEFARAQGMDIEGPIPPDTAFIPEKRKHTDLYICMYHDQGHIPVKMLAFDSCVNITLGLPIIRTSVDHGTAYDIAWQGKANPGSLYNALRLAAHASLSEPKRVAPFIYALF